MNSPKASNQYLIKCFLINIDLAINSLWSLRENSPILDRELIDFENQLQKLSKELKKKKYLKSPKK